MIAFWVLLVFCLFSFRLTTFYFLAQKCIAMAHRFLSHEYLYILISGTVFWTFFTKLFYVLSWPHVFWLFVSLLFYFRKHRSFFTYLDIDTPRMLWLFHRKYRLSPDYLRNARSTRIPTSIMHPIATQYAPPSKVCVCISKCLWMRVVVVDYFLKIFVHHSLASL